MFNVPELLEAILLGLPIKDILVNSQRVCKQWHATIQSSPQLQKAPFFQPLDTTRLALGSEHAESGRSSYIWRQNEGDVREHRVQANPWLGRYLSRIHNDLRGGMKETMCRPEPSWRRMLIAQPAISSAEAYCCQYPYHGSRTTRITRAEGIRVGDLIHVDTKGKECGLTNVFGRGFWELVEDAADVHHLIKRHGTSTWEEVK